MKYARKIQLDLSAETKHQLDGQSKICNWLYNHLLEVANRLREDYRQYQKEETSKTLYTKRGLRDLVPSLKEEKPFLRTVYSSPIKNTALRLSRAVQDYQKSRKGKRKGKKTGWPTFRAWKRKWFSLEYDEPWKGYELADSKHLCLHLGKESTGKQLKMHLSFSEPFPMNYQSSVKTLRIIKEGDKYFAVFTVDREIQNPLVNDRKPFKAIALDPNHKNFAYGVDTEGMGIEIGNMPGLKALDKRIDQLKSRRDRCVRKSKRIVYPDGKCKYLPSRRWKHSDDLLQEAYRIRREQIKTFLYTLSNRLYKNYALVGLGNYAPRGGGITTGMRRSMNNQSQLGRFKQVMAWVGQKSGRLYFEYDEKGTTRTCHICGFIVEGGIEPDIREWDCPGCGTHHLRDENAAHNGLRRTLKEYKNLLPRLGHLGGHPAITTRCAWSVRTSGVVITPRGMDGVAIPEISTFGTQLQEIKPGSWQIPTQDVAYAA